MNGAEPLEPLDRTSRRAFAAGLAVLAVLAAVKLCAPDDFDAHDQAKQGLYVVDAFSEGRWLVPMEQGLDYPTKPPLMTWMSLAIAFAQGRVTEIGARAPSLLAAGLALWGTLRFARHLGALASVATAVAFFANWHVIACSTLARTDMLLCAANTFAVGQVFESFVAFREGKPARGKLILAAAFAGIGTVAKSPVALACPAFALAVFVAIEPKARAFARAVVLPALPIAALVYVAIVGAWFVPAARTAGPKFVKTLADELLGHVAGTGDYARREGHPQPPFYPLLHLTMKFMPWSALVILAGLGSWRAARPEALPLPPLADNGRDARRFAIAALLGSLAFFALMKIKRPDHVLPCYPWAACLAGALVADWSLGRLASRPARLVDGVLRALACVAFAASLVGPILLRVARVFDPSSIHALNADRRQRLADQLDSVAVKPWLILGVALLAVPVGAVLWTAARRRSQRLALVGVASFMALVLGVYEHALSESVVEQKAEAIRGFGEVVHDLARGRLVSVHVGPPSFFFYLGESRPPAYDTVTAARELDAGAWGVVTNERWLTEISETRRDLVRVRSSNWGQHSGEPMRLFLLVRSSEGIVPDDPARGVAEVWWPSW